MENYISEAIELRIKEFVADWNRRIKECEESGHREPEFLKYWVTSRSSHFDKALGHCNYCHTSFERGLTSQEHQEIEDFREGFHKDYVKAVLM